jgi:hypothetical protein
MDLASTPFWMKHGLPETLLIDHLQPKLQTGQHLLSERFEKPSWRVHESQSQSKGRGHLKNDHPAVTV